MIRGLLVGSVVLFIIYIIQTFFFSLIVQKNEVSISQKYRSLIWGAIGAVILSSLFQISLITFLKAITSKSKAMTIWAIIVAPITEEISKGLAPAYFAYRFKQYNWRVLAYIGALSGLGFFLTETFLAFVQPNISKANLVKEITNRGVALSLMHPLAVIFTGTGIGLFFSLKNRIARFAFPCICFLSSFSIHFFNNAATVLISQGKNIDQTVQAPVHLALCIGVLILARIHISLKGKACDQSV